MDEKALAELEAEQFLASLSQPPGLEEITDKDWQTIRKNEQIINAVDVCLIERLESKDTSFKGSELSAIRAEAFRQNQALKGRDTVDMTKLIPTNINIQIINN